MTFFPSLPDDATSADIFLGDPEFFSPFLDFSQKAMRGDCDLTPGQRELIGAYVSALNGCTYCAGGHIATAAEFGMEPVVLEQLLDNLDGAQVAENLKPILRYVGKLTTTPARMVQADADAVYAAGWSERTLRRAIVVCGLFNFMNRVVKGHGLETDPAKFAERGRRHFEFGYDMAGR